MSCCHCCCHNCCWLSCIGYQPWVIVIVTIIVGQLSHGIIVITLDISTLLSYHCNCRCQHHWVTLPSLLSSLLSSLLCCRAGCWISTNCLLLLSPCYCWCCCFLNFSVVVVVFVDVVVSLSTLLGHVVVLVAVLLCWVPDKQAVSASHYVLDQHQV